MHGRWISLEGSSRDRPGVRESTWTMYERTYSAIGLILRGPGELKEYDVWDLYVTPGSGGQTPTAFRLAKRTPYGLKGGLTGSDGTHAGKKIVREHLQDWFLVRGHYGEVSHGVERIALAAGSPVVCSADVSGVIGKTITPESDGVHYRRDLAQVGSVVKVLVGTPRGVRTTNAQDPDCPRSLGGVPDRQGPWIDRSREALLDHMASLVI